MNTFSVFIKEDGSWKETTGKPVFPFSRGELLDERLDEAYITLVKDTREIYSPLTEIKVTVGSDNKYYVVARDDATKNQLTKLYKHSLYVIERTKLLEGVICPSLTFTNTNGAAVNRSNVNDGVYTTGQFEYNGVLKFFIETPKGVSLSYPIVTKPITATAYRDEMLRRFNSVRANRYKKDFSHDPYVTVAYTEGTEEKTATFTSSKAIEIPINTVKHIEYFFALDDKALVNNTTMYYRVKHTVSVANINVKPTKKLSITDCVNRVLDLAEPLFTKGISNTTRQAARYKFNSADAEKYKDVIAPAFSMTESTLREQLQIIGSKIHAEPRLNENDEIYFDEYGSSKVSPIGNTDYIYEGATWDVNEYCTEVRSNAKNLTSSLDYASISCIEPARSLFRTIRSEQQYVRVTTENGIVKTDFPVYAIKKVMCGILASSGSGYWIDPVDISGYVFESTFYGTQLSSYGSDGTSSRSLALFYTQGERNIRGLFTKEPNAISNTLSEYAIVCILALANQNGKTLDQISKEVEGTAKNPTGTIGRLVFQVSYIPVYDVTVAHGKGYDNINAPRFSKVYNQSEQLVESSYYGENIKGVAARLGNVEKERTFILQSLDNIPKVGQMLNGYAISAVNSEINTNYIKCTVGLTKDFNRISAYIGVSSVRRMYEISERNVSERNIFVHNTVLLGDKVTGISATDRAIYRNTDDIIAVPLKGYPEVAAYTKPISFAAAQCFPKRNPGDNDATEDNAHNLVILPVIPTSLGNSMIFSFSYADNYSAGSAVKFLNAEGVLGYWQDDVPYTDENGKAYWLKFGFSNGSQELETSITNPRMLPRAYDVSGNDPRKNQISNVSFKNLCTLGGDRYPLLLRKDNREKISLTYEIEFKSNRQDLVIGSALASGNPLVKDIGASGVGEARIVFFGARPNKFTTKAPVSDDDVTLTSQCFVFKKEAVNGVDVLTMYEDHRLDGQNIIEKAPSGNEIIDVVVGQYSFGAPRDIKGFAIVTSPNSVTSTVVDEDGVETEQTIEYGGEVLMMRIADIKEGEPLFGKDESGNPRKIYFNVLPN